MADHIKIINGPSKWDLMLALFEGRTITFQLFGSVNVKVRVESIYNASDWDTISGDGFKVGRRGDWLLKGMLEEPYPDISSPNETYVAYAAYSSESRIGILRCIDAKDEELVCPDLHTEWANRVWGDNSWL